MSCYSLPANVERGELAQQLSDHLAAYSQIKTVKVVRDNRGGVCAFVQCEVRIARELCTSAVLMDTAPNRVPLLLVTFFVR